MKQQERIEILVYEVNTKLFWGPPVAKHRHTHFTLRYITLRYITLRYFTLHYKSVIHFYQNNIIHYNELCNFEFFSVLNQNKIIQDYKSDDS